MVTEIPWLCRACRHLVAGSASCPAFPEQGSIPITPLFKGTTLLHDTILPDQEGTTVFESKGDEQSKVIESLVRSYHA